MRRAFLLSLSAAGLWLAWAQTQQPAQLALEKVTDNLYVIVGSGGNVAVVPTSEGVILVDDKFPQDNPQIVAKVKSISDKPIRYVVNTHHHGDHTGGNAAMIGGGAEILLHRNARVNMVKGEMPGIPRISFADEASVTLGGKEVVARHFGRGHTNGDAIVFVPSERAIHTGDLFTNADIPLCDPNANCSIKDWDQTLRKALTYDFDIVIPGHGPVMKKADLAKYADGIAAFRERMRGLCKSMTPDAAAKQLNLTGLRASGVPAMCRELAQ